MSHPTDADRDAMGRRIKRAREALGLSVAETATAAQIDRTQLHRVERGKSAPSVPTLVLLADALAVSMEVQEHYMRGYSRGYRDGLRDGGSRN